MVDSLLKTKKIIVCVGTGGVGKTTTAASLAFRSAQLGNKTLVITVDPSKRLATSLDINEELETTSIFSPSFKGSLEGMVIDSGKVFDEFVKSYTKNKERLEKILANKLYIQLKSKLNGAEEFTYLIKLLQMVESKKYDLIVLDTPPAQNMRDFLKAPIKLKSLFESSIVQFFLKKREGGILNSILNSGSEQVFKLLQYIVGKGFIAELRQFFTLTQEWHSKIIFKMTEIQKVLTREETVFVLVMGGDLVKMEEGRQFAQELQKDGYHLSSYLVNKSYPSYWNEKENRKSDNSLDYKANSVEMNWFKLYKEMDRFYRERKKDLLTWQDKFEDKIPIILTPEFSSDICDIEGIERMAYELAKEKN